MPISDFDIIKRRERRNQASEKDISEKAQAHIAAMTGGSDRHVARLNQYKTGPLGEVMDFITNAMTAPGNRAHWDEIIEMAKKGGSGLGRDPDYRDFQADVDNHLSKLGEDFQYFRLNINDALRPKNMTHFLTHYVDDTMKNQNEKLHDLIAEHICPIGEEMSREAGVKGAEKEINRNNALRSMAHDAELHEKLDHHKRRQTVRSCGFG